MNDRHIDSESAKLAGLLKDLLSKLIAGNIRLDQFYWWLNLHKEKRGRLQDPNSFFDPIVLTPYKIFGYAEVNQEVIANAVEKEKLSIDSEALSMLQAFNSHRVFSGKFCAFKISVANLGFSDGASVKNVFDKIKELDFFTEYPRLALPLALKSRDHLSESLIVGSGYTEEANQKLGYFVIRPERTDIVLSGKKSDPAEMLPREQKIVVFK